MIGRIQTYIYGDIEVKAIPIPTTITIGGEVIRTDDLGYIISYNGVPATDHSPGALGMSPRGTTELIKKLERVESRQFSIDFTTKTIRFGRFNDKDRDSLSAQAMAQLQAEGLQVPYTTWIDAAAHDEQWLIPASSTNLGATVLSTMEVAIIMSEDRINTYFEQWPSDMYEWQDGMMYIQCDQDLSALPPLEIRFFGRTPTSGEPVWESFDLPAAKLGPDSAPDNTYPWCPCFLQPLKQGQHLGAEAVIGYVEESSRLYMVKNWLT